VLDGQPALIYNITDDFTRLYEGPFLYAVAFYKSPRLEYGTHTLTVTVDRWYTGLKGYIFDFVTVGGRNETNSDVIIVDESDSAVQYSGHWAIEGSPEYEYQGTTHKSTTAGSTAVFQFNGSSIDVFGTIRGTSDQPDPLIAFQIDDGDKGYFKPPNTGGATRPKVRFYSTGGLSDSPHTLRIESVGSGEFWLDYFMYKPHSGTPSTSPQQGKVSTGAIIGGVVGGVAGLALIIFLAFFLYRRRKKYSKVPQEPQHPVMEQGQGGSLGYPASQGKAPRFFSTHPATTPLSSNPANTNPALSVTPYTIESYHDSGRQSLSSGTGFSPSYQTSSIPPASEAQFVSFSPPVNEAPRFVPPLPQKYRPSQEQVYQIRVPEHDPSGSSAYTSSDIRDTRSPPPNYSAADGSIVRY
jgi:hypothetical protein